MKNGSRECFMCKYFDLYYTKGEVRFNKTKCGWCCKQAGTVGIHDTCERYERRKKIEKYPDSIRVSLNKMLIELSTVRRLLEAERDEIDEDKEV